MCGDFGKPALHIHHPQGSFAMRGPQGSSGAAGAATQAEADRSAEYYMHCYKVVLCPKQYSHDWGACPFAHDKENARRRDPQAYNYSSCICPNASKGECPSGLQCPYSHTLFEYWLHPSRFRTQMCRAGANCKRSLCFFAHNAAELRTPSKDCLPASQPQLPPQPQLQLQQQPLAALGVLGNFSAGFRSGSDASATSQELNTWPLSVEERSASSFTSQSSLLGGGCTAPAVAVVASAGGPVPEYVAQLRQLQQLQQGLQAQQDALLREVAAASSAGMGGALGVPMAAAADLVGGTTFQVLPAALVTSAPSLGTLAAPAESLVVLSSPCLPVTSLPAVPAFDSGSNVLVCSAAPPALAFDSGSNALVCSSAPGAAIFDSGGNVLVGSSAPGAAIFDSGGNVLVGSTELPRGGAQFMDAFESWV